MRKFSYNFLVCMSGTSEWMFGYPGWRIQGFPSLDSATAGSLDSQLGGDGSVGVSSPTASVQC